MKCHDCGEMKKEIGGIKDQLNQLPEMRDQLNQLNELPEIKDQISSIKEDMKEVKAMMGEVLHKLNNAEHVVQIPLHVNPTKEDIVIASSYNPIEGGYPWEELEPRNWLPSTF